MLTQYLAKLDFTEKERTIYMVLAELGVQPASAIARRCNLDRVTTYKHLKKLSERGFVKTYFRDGVQCFAPEPPEQLEQLAKEKVNIAKSLLPELRTLASSLKFKPKIRFYEGRDGVERVFTESLSAEEEILGYTNLKIVTEFFPNFFKGYTRKRLKKGIKTRYLSPNTVETVHVIDPFLPEKYDPNLIEILLVNKDQFPFENEVLIFGDTVGIVSLNPDELLGLLVESATFAQTMKAVFDLAWLGATAFVAK